MLREDFQQVFPQLGAKMVSHDSLASCNVCYLLLATCNLLLAAAVCLANMRANYV